MGVRFWQAMVRWQGWEGTKGREGGDYRGGGVKFRGGWGWGWGGAMGGDGGVVASRRVSILLFTDLWAVQAVCHSIGDSLWVGYIFPAVTMEERLEYETSSFFYLLVGGEAAEAGRRRSGRG